LGYSGRLLILLLATTVSPMNLLNVKLISLATFEYKLCNQPLFCSLLFLWQQDRFWEYE
jgi:hypothetical protein